jgi:ketosteroid isomerase-like protein
MRRRKKKTADKPRTADDAWADMVRETVARAMAKHLRDDVNVMRPINSLTLPELMKVAETATATWIGLAAQRIHDQPESVEAVDYFSLLM